MVRAGSIIGLGVYLDPGFIINNMSITVEVMKSVINNTTGVRTDTATGLLVTFGTDSSATRSFATVTQAMDLDTFNPGDEIWLRYSTHANFLPLDAKINAVVEIET